MADPCMTNPSKPFSGQRFAVFLVTVILMHFTLWFAHTIGAKELGSDVIMWESLVGGSLILGRSAVHFSEAWSVAKRGKTTK